MSAHHLDPGEPRFTDAEPAAFAEAARIILAALVTGGWLAIDSSVINWLVTGIGLLASVAFTAWTRNRVTPVAAPTSSEGVPLAPVGRTPPTEPPTAP